MRFFCLFIGIMCCGFQLVAQSVMVISEAKMSNLRMLPCHIKDSILIEGNAIAELLYAYDHVQYSDSSKRETSLIKLLCGTDKSVQIDMHPFYNIMSQQGNTDINYKQRLSEAGTASNAFISLVCDYSNSMADVVCGDYFQIDKPYYYSEELELSGWEVLDSFKTICNYECQAAVKEYKGRKWIVWFTYDIPIPAGPWKLCGLPGLILRASTDDDLFTFECVAIKSADKKMYSYQYSKGKKFRSFEEWYKHQKGTFDSPLLSFAEGGQAIIVLKKGDGTTVMLDENWRIPFIYPLEQ